MFVFVAQLSLAVCDGHAVAGVGLPALSPSLSHPAPWAHVEAAGATRITEVGPSLGGLHLSLRVRLALPRELPLAGFPLGLGGAPLRGCLSSPLSLSRSPRGFCPSRH